MACYTSWTGRTENSCEARHHLHVTWNSGFDRTGVPILTKSDICARPLALNWTDVAYARDETLLWRVTIVVELLPLEKGVWISGGKSVVRITSEDTAIAGNDSAFG